MKRSRLLNAALLSMLICGCTATPVRYYTLIQPISPADEAASAQCCNVRISRVLIPAEVDRPELVLRTSKDQVSVLSNATWLAPLRDEIRGALTSQINQRLGAAASKPAANVREPAIFVNVTRFDSMPAQYVVVTANWRIQPANLPKADLTTCQTTARINVSGGLSALVQGYQQAIVMIADHIALDLLDAARTGVPGCSSERPPSSGQT